MMHIYILLFFLNISSYLKSELWSVSMLFSCDGLSTYFMTKKKTHTMFSLQYK